MAHKDRKEILLTYTHLIASV